MHASYWSYVTSLPSGAECDAVAFTARERSVSGEQYRSETISYATVPAGDISVELNKTKKKLQRKLQHFFLSLFVVPDCFGAVSLLSQACFTKISLSFRKKFLSPRIRNCSALKETQLQHSECGLGEFRRSVLGDYSVRTRNHPRKARIRISSGGLFLSVPTWSRCSECMRSTAEAECFSRWSAAE